MLVQYACVHRHDNIHNDIMLKDEALPPFAPAEAARTDGVLLVSLDS